MEDRGRTYTCGALCAWGAFGFLHGGHWCILSSMAVSYDCGDRWLPRNHGLSYAAGLLVTAAGGAYCQSGIAVACPGGEDMSRDCFWSMQTVDYQIIYILHYIGLAWNFAHWVMDGAQLWFWSKEMQHQKSLSLVATGVPMKKFVYSGILWLAVLLITLTWTWLLDWTTGIDSANRNERIESTLSRLAGIILVEVVCVLVVACAVLRSVMLFIGEEKVGEEYADTSLS